MDSGKPEKLRKHKKEIKRRAYINIFLTAIVGLGLGATLWSPLAGFLSLFVGSNTAVASVLVLVALSGLVYMMPSLHFREEDEIKSDKDPEYYLGKGLDEVPWLEMLKSQGWEELESTEERIKMEAYPSFFHRIINKKSSLEIELLDKNENSLKLVIRKDGEEIEKLRSVIEPEDEGSLIHETGVSLRRYSPAHLELMLFILPEVQKAFQAAAEEKLELLDENIDYGLKKFDLKNE